MKSPSEASNARVLVVDDEASLVKALISTLHENGYTVVGATTPSQALELLRAERFDVMLTDLHLPELDGIALLRSALEIDPALIGIMMTGHGSIDSAVDAMKAGAVDYVLKPFKLKPVLSVLSRALQLRRLRQQNEVLTRDLVAKTQQLEFANQELEAFSYSVSHDLRAPLRAIEGFTDLLIEACEDGTKEMRAEHSDRIRRGVRRMQTIIDDLLKMARAARNEINVADVDLAPIAQDTIARLAASAHERKYHLSVAPDLQVKGDAGLLRIAVENLVENAWKYTAHSPLTEIQIAASSAPGEKIISIRDNGVGFDMAEAKKLFTPFTRLSSGHSFEGTGIGLATVDRIIRRHGGRTWAEAQPGAGATFFFSLPTNSR